jgi:cell wall assembly regulator SMI1
MALEIRELWTAIESWYRAHVGPEQIVADFMSRAGDDAGMPWNYDASQIAILGGPATEDEVANVEAVLGFPFPADVRASYLSHNGSKRNWILEYGSLLSLDDIVDQWRMREELIELCESEVSHPSGPIKPVHWNTRWIPLTDNGGGDPVCVDCDPAPNGTVGQIIKFNHEVGPEHVIATSLHAWLGQFVEELDSGLIVYDEDSIFRRAAQQ